MRRGGAKPVVMSPVKRYAFACLASNTVQSIGVLCVDCALGAVIAMDYESEEFRDTRLVLLEDAPGEQCELCETCQPTDHGDQQPPNVTP